MSSDFPLENNSYERVLADPIDDDFEEDVIYSDDDYDDDTDD